MITKMSIHRALSELKLYDSKIYDLLQRPYIMAVKTNAKTINGLSVEEQTETMKASFQSLKALMRNRQILKSAIAASNENTNVVIAGETMTVLDAIERKNYLSIREQVLNQLRAQFNRAQAAVKQYEDNFQTGLERYINSATRETANKELIETLTKSYRNLNEVSLIDPNELSKTIEVMATEIVNFKTEVDYVLSESNATTFIEVDLAG